MSRGVSAASLRTCVVPLKIFLFFFQRAVACLIHVTLNFMSLNCQSMFLTCIYPKFAMNLPCFFSFSPWQTLYINLCFWPVKSVETWAWHASLHLGLYDSFFIPIGREQQSGQLCNTSRDKELFTQSGQRPYHFIAGGVLCWKKSLNS